VSERRFGFLSSTQRLGDGFIDNRFSTGCGTRGLDSRGRDHAGRFRGRRDVLGLLYCRSLLLRRGVRPCARDIIFAQISRDLLKGIQRMSRLFGSSDFRDATFESLTRSFLRISVIGFFGAVVRVRHVFTSSSSPPRDVYIGYP
jgi:hypothetical protein